MSTFKKFKSENIIISPLEVNRGFTFQNGDALTGSDVQIDRFLGTDGNFLDTQSETGQIVGDTQYSVLIYDSIKQLYYTNYLSGSDGYVSDSSATSSFATGIYDTSSYGFSSYGISSEEGATGSENLNEFYRTIYYNYEQTTLKPEKYFQRESIGVISIPSKLYGDTIEPGSIVIESATSGTLYDDGEGRLYSTGESGTGNFYVGNIIYEHGVIAITNQPSGEII